MGLIHQWAVLAYVLVGQAPVLLNAVKELVMGFTPEPTVYNLNFDEGSKYPGLKVKIKGCTVREWNEMMEMAIADEANEVVKNNRRSMELFLTHLVEWNMTMPGDPTQDLPATWDGIQEVDNKIITDLYVAWQKAMTTVPEELGKGLTNGSGSEEALLGLAASLGSQPNFPTPSS